MKLDFAVRIKLNDFYDFFEDVLEQYFLDVDIMSYSDAGKGRFLKELNTWALRHNYSKGILGAKYAVRDLVDSIDMVFMELDKRKAIRTFEDWAYEHTDMGGELGKDMAQMFENEARSVGVRWQ